MIQVLRNNNGLIYAYIEWQVVNKDGQFENNGEYIYIQDLWVHEKWRHQRCINRLIHNIDKHDFAKNAKFVYWVRGKYEDRLSDCFSRTRSAKLGDKGDNNGFKDNNTKRTATACA